MIQVYFALLHFFVEQEVGHMTALGIREVDKCNLYFGSTSSYLKEGKLDIVVKVAISTIIFMIFYFFA